MSPITRTLAAALCALLFAGCQKGQEPPKTTEPATPGGERKVEAKSGEPTPLKWHEGMIPTAAEADLALSMGRTFFEQAKFVEAEEQLKIASAGGKSEADGLLLRARSELAAKDHLAAARRALDENDLTKAEQELQAIPGESVLRSIADGMAEKVEATRERKSREFEEKVRQAVQDEIKLEDAPAAKDEEAADEDKVADEKANADEEGIPVIKGKPTDQDGEDDEEEEASAKAE